MRTDQRTPRRRSRTGRTATIAAVAAALAVARIAASNRTTSTADSTTDTRTSPTIDETHTGVTPMRTEDHTTSKRSWTGRLAGRTATIAAVAAALTVGGIAAASWNIAGSGSGAAEATTVENLTVSVSADGDLYPGAAVDATLTVTNNNPFPVLITAVTFSGDVVVGAPAGTCTAVNSEVAFANATGLNIEVAANASAVEFDSALVGVITMGSGSDDACQGKTFTRPFAVTAAIDN